MRDSSCLISWSDRSLRDSCIREPLQSWLQAQHVDAPDTIILQEVKIPRPSARADMVVVNGEFCGFEIKSDVDSLRRLNRQAQAFNAVFDRVCLVTTQTHLDKARRSVPPWWGILVPSPSNTRQFVSVRKSRKNPRIDLVALLHMLLRRELQQIAQNASVDVSVNKMKRSELIDLIQKTLTKNQIRMQARALFKLRRTIDYSSPP